MSLLLMLTFPFSLLAGIIMNNGHGVLDDAHRIRRLDPSGMLASLGDASNFLLKPGAATKLEDIDSGRIENIVFGGVGGSAIAADIVVDWLREKLDVPAEVVRDTRPPSFIGRETLFVALSYSGETKETLSLYASAKQKKCQVVGVTAGGRLLKQSRRDRVPLVTVRPSVSPRAALYQMIGACSLVLEKTGSMSNLRAAIRESAKEISNLKSSYHSDRPYRSNSAKKFAAELENILPAIYSLQRMSSVARRFKNQLNENSKVPAKFDLLPESGHNEVEAWRGVKSLRPVFIRDHKESKTERRIIEAFKRTIVHASGSDPLDVQVQAPSKLGRLLGPTFFLDYVSIYLAYLRGVDPTPTPFIKEFRNRLTHR